MWRRPRTVPLQRLHDLLVARELPGQLLSMNDRKLYPPANTQQLLKDGAATAAPFLFSGGPMRRSPVVALLLALVTLPLHAAGRARALPHVPLIAPTLYLGPAWPLSDRGVAAANTAVAFRGASGIAVWLENYTTLRYAMLAADGTPLQPGGVPLAEDGAEQSDPIAGAAGDRFLVVWSEGDAHATQLVASIVGADGRVDNLAPIVVASLHYPPLRETVACSDRDCLVVWLENTTGPLAFGTMHGVRVSLDGTLLDPAPLTLATSTIGGAVSSDGAQYLVVWPGTTSDRASSALFAESVVNGRIGAASIVVASQRDWLLYPAMVRNGAGWLLTWSSIAGGPSIATEEVRATRLDGAGTAIDTPYGIEVAHAPTAWVDAPPPGGSRVVWDGINYVALTRAGFARIAAGGQLIDNVALPDEMSVTSIAGIGGGRIALAGTLQTTGGAFVRVLYDVPDAQPRLSLTGQ
jgi:hypothetical protein